MTFIPILLLLWKQFLIFINISVMWYQKKVGNLGWAFIATLGITTVVCGYLGFQRSVSIILASIHRAYHCENSVCQTGSEDARKIKNCLKTRESKSKSKSKQITKKRTDLKGSGEFRAVTRGLDLKKLTAFALRCRTLSLGLSKQLSCTVDPKPMRGSSNLVYKLYFSDGLRWIARIPICGQKLPGHFKDKMNTEYSTMKYIKSRTHLPIPEVYWWTTSTVEVGTAFALVSHVEGNSVADLWNWMPEQKRLKVLENIAGCMVQLYTLQFDQIGMLQFHDQGTCTHLGPKYKKLPNPELKCPQPRLSCKSYQSLGPWLDNLIMSIERDPQDKDYYSYRRLYRMMVETIPEFMNRVPIAVAHRDINWHKILIDPETCAVTGLLGWDDIGTQPVIAGCARYPNWITRDWNPAVYNHGRNDDGTNTCLDPSPDTLSKYRKHYSSCWQLLCDDTKYDTRWTKLSHIFQNIQIGSSDFRFRHGMAEIILHHAFQGDLNFTMSDYSQACCEDRTEEYDGRIQKAFQNMWYAEWERPAEQVMGHLSYFWYTRYYKRSDLSVNVYNDDMIEKIMEEFEEDEDLDEDFEEF